MPYSHGFPHDLVYYFNRAPMVETLRRTDVQLNSHAILFLVTVCRPSPTLEQGDVADHGVGFILPVALLKALQVAEADHHAPPLGSLGGAAPPPAPGRRRCCRRPRQRRAIKRVR